MTEHTPLNDLITYEAEIKREHFSIAVQAAYQAAHGDQRGIDWPTYPEAFVLIAEYVLDALRVEYDIPEEYQAAINAAYGNDD